MTVLIKTLLVVLALVVKDKYVHLGCSWHNFTNLPFLEFMETFIYFFNSQSELQNAANRERKKMSIATRLLMISTPVLDVNSCFYVNYTSLLYKYKKLVQDKFLLCLCAYLQFMLIIAICWETNKRFWQSSSSAKF